MLSACSNGPEKIIEDFISQFISTRELVKYIHLYKLSLVVLLETSYYSGIKRKQDSEMCCSEMSVRI